MPAEHVVIRSVRRHPSELLAAFAGHGVATVHEAMGRRGLVDPALRPRQDDVQVAGSAVTVLCQAGDNLMIHAAVEQCAPGDVLVVATASPSTDGMFGELLATSLQARGVAGLVIDAGVRDVAELRRMSFPVWSRSVSAQGTVKATAGSVNVPITCGNQLVNPGDVVVADDDGIVVVPHGDAPTVDELSAQRVHAEEAKRKELAAGRLGLDMYGLRPLLAGLGVEYRDE